MESKGLITHSNPKSPVSEAYRVLRTNIQYSSFDKPLKTIVITSSGPGEGKTTTVINLAITFAQMGSRVLLIDADMRKPRIHKVFEINNRTGLTNLLATHGDYKAFMNKCPVTNLDVLTCGVIPPNPSELLTSNAMKQFMEKVKNDYDIVFLDSPPVGTVTDAAILSAIVDGTILVAASGTLEISDLIRAKELLGNVKANIIGVVLNKLDKKAQGNYYYYYYYYYGENNETAKRKKHRQIPQHAEV
jgi:protein-tyrosine kinase